MILNFRFLLFTLPVIDLDTEFSTKERLFSFSFGLTSIPAA